MTASSGESGTSSVSSRLRWWPVSTIATSADRVPSGFAPTSRFATASIGFCVAAYDDTTLHELWKINLGSRFSAPPMTFEANGKQFVAIASGLGARAKVKLANSPELRDQRNATVLYFLALARCCPESPTRLRAESRHGWLRSRAALSSA
jgi:hypothetical protein